LQLYPNLNEIVLNFVSIDNCLYLYHIIKYYNRFKQYLQNFKQIKFRIVDENYKAYNEIYVKYSYLDFCMKFFKNVFEPNVKQKVYLSFNYSNIDVVHNYLNYDIIINSFFIDKQTVLYNLEEFKKYNIYYSIKGNYDFKFKINKINDMNKYFIIKNDLIEHIKPNYIYKVKYLDNFELYYHLFKIKHTNLQYLREYITNANNIINTIYNKRIKPHMIEFCLNIHNMYKYGVINIYENIIDNIVIYNKFNLLNKIRNINVFKYFLFNKAKFKHSLFKHNLLILDIKKYIRY